MSSIVLRRVVAKSSGHTLGMLGKKFSLKSNNMTDVFNFVFGFHGKGLRNDDDRNRGRPSLFQSLIFFPFKMRRPGHIPLKFRWSLAFCADVNNPGSFAFQF